MNFLNLPVFKAMMGQMEWLNRRQSVLSENMANSDTPGYTPNDLQKIDFGEILKNEKSASAIHKAQLAAAEHRNQGYDLTGAGRNAEEIQAKGLETSPTGNSVVLEEQLIKVSETQIQYSMLTNLYRKQADMIRMAIGRR